MNMQLLLSAAASELESMRQKEMCCNGGRKSLEHTPFPSACLSLLYSIPGKNTTRYDSVMLIENFRHGILLQVHCYFVSILVGRCLFRYHRNRISQQTPSYKNNDHH